MPPPRCPVWRFVGLAASALVALAGAASCSRDAARAATATGAAGDATSTHDIAAVDTCSAPGEPCPLAPDEQCHACFARLAECCYGDKDIMGQIAVLEAACEARPTCRRCCDECTAQTCAQLIADKSCPNLH